MKIFEQKAQIAGLAWGVHEPFRDYINRMSDGHMYALEGAELLETEETFFPLDTQRTSADALRFIGSLQFTGHHGMLAVRIQQPWLQQVDDMTALTITDPFEENARMPMVHVELGNDSAGSTQLMEEGADVFMGNYRTNTAFDPVRIVWIGKD
ncbi:hypothetical protein GCM10009720_10120 [Yaniella flava]|uniref:Htaa domain-containing protein n=1 Tax=Yaniella flava TaxID=287930 RepID=A0ABP5FTL9_9MICC|nr:HtaA domain-containing protein [Micrococcaceae bacterium]